MTGLSFLIYSPYFEFLKNYLYFYLFIFTKVQLTIRTLPELPIGAKYKCVFGDAEPIEAAVTATGLSCRTPDLQSRPSIDQSSSASASASSASALSSSGSSLASVSDHVLVPLSVRSSETNKDFVSRNFAFYDCSRHRTCSSCVKAQWACNWCVHENRCTHNASTCQRTVVSGENVSQIIIISSIYFIEFIHLMIVK